MNYSFKNVIIKNILTIITLLLLNILCVSAWSNEYSSVVQSIQILQEQAEQLQIRIMKRENVVRQNTNDIDAKKELKDLLKEKENLEKQINVLKNVGILSFKPNATVKIEEPHFGVMYSKPRKKGLFRSYVDIDRKGYHLKQGARVQLLDEKYVTLFRRYHYGKVKYLYKDFVEVGWVRIGNGEEYWYWIEPDNRDEPYK